MPHIPPEIPFIELSRLTPEHTNRVVVTRGHVHEMRVKGKKIAFLVIRHIYDTLQVVAAGDLVSVVAGSASPRDPTAYLVQVAARVGC